MEKQKSPSKKGLSVYLLLKSIITFSELLEHSQEVQFLL